MNIVHKIAAGVTSGIILSALLAGSTFAANVNISGNGAGSVNLANILKNKNLNVLQGNTSVISVSTVHNHNTGNNLANDNLGAGNVNTSGANSNVGVLVGGSTNDATLSGCGCNNPLNVNISGNLAGSLNMANYTSNHNTNVTQSNVSVIGVSSVSNQNTGGNTANDNLGSGNVNTGPANSNTSVTVVGSSNSLTLNP